MFKLFKNTDYKQLYEEALEECRIAQANCGEMSENFDRAIKQRDHALDKAEEYQAKLFKTEEELLNAGYQIEVLSKEINKGK